MNRSAWLRLAPVAVLLALGATPMASAQEHFQAVVRGTQETPANASVGRGHLDLTISADGTQISYTLVYPSVPGGVTQAHLHLGQLSVAGGIFLFLCTNLGNGPAGTQACPDAPGQVSGTWTASDITSGAAGQGIEGIDQDDVQVAGQAAGPRVRSPPSRMPWTRACICASPSVPEPTAV